jgi:threonine synthase
MDESESLATGLRCLSCGESFPLDPRLFAGCTACLAEQFQAPLDVTYDYPASPQGLFPDYPLPGLTHYARLLPPLRAELSLGEGGTPLVHTPELAAWVGTDAEISVKDESRNPTWSHKDRFAYLVVCGALEVKAQAIIVSSTGNHGAAIAAYAARAGLPCIVLAPAYCPPAVQSLLLAYGAAVVILPRRTSWSMIGEGALKGLWYPGSTFTPTPTGPPYGVEGYKTIAYEIWLQLGRRIPEVVFVPTGYGELLYGVWKGFRELRSFGLADSAPRMAACEPAAMAPLRKALSEGKGTTYVPSQPTIAYAIAASVNGYRAVVAMEESGGFSVPVTDQEMEEAQAKLAHVGLWAEASAAASLAGLRKVTSQGEHLEGPVVCVSTSSGFKDLAVGDANPPQAEGTWEGLEDALMRDYGIVL